jgi:hypothetical protein
MCRQALVSFLLVAILSGLSSAPAAACPWNGCGTDAHNSAQDYAYYAPFYDFARRDYGYAPPFYRYTSPVYGYAGPVYRYARPVYGYAPPVYLPRAGR